jgi:ferredoxin-NADP reductase
MICTVIDNSKGVRQERGLHAIMFSVENPFEYQHGDLLDIELPTKPGHNRQYSIAGEVGVNRYDLLVRDTGDIGSYLCSLKPGEIFEADYIGGVFHPQAESVLICSGSGFAPFRSMIVADEAQGCYLFHNLDSLDELPAITGPVGEDIISIYTESVADQLEAIKESMPDLLGRDFYVCGASRYVTEMCSKLVEFGVPSLAIQTDMYGASID